MKHYRLLNCLVGWAVFAIAAFTYLSTIESTASFWDCGEFISSAYKLDVGHPPGAPFFMLTAHFFTLFAKDAGQVAVMVNSMSALLSALTILFLFWTITALAKKMVVGRGEEMSLGEGIGILLSGAVGALAYTFSDTFWFSAVEGEVYAYSSFFTALVFWAILKWEEVADEPGSDRWLIFIAYMMGLSIGVHLLNLLAIPAIVLVYYFHRTKQPTFKGFLLAMIISAGLLAVVLYGMIPGFVLVAGWFELLFTNTLGLPFNTGTAVYIVLTVALLIWSLWETHTGNSDVRTIISYVLAVSFVGIPFFGESVLLGILLIAALTALLWWKREQIECRWLNTSVAMIAVMLIGYASYGVIVIRSNVDPPMDQNSPDNVFALKYYLNREQYGDRPLFYGATYNAPVQLRVEGNLCVPEEKIGHAQYAPKVKTDPNEKDRYVVTGHKTSYKMDRKFMMLFPRMYSPQPNHIEAYKSWANVKGRRVNYEYCGQQRSDYKPTFGENLKFFFSYQCNFMYWRYFMWNFSGRQNDMQGYGEMDKGNWITGIKPIDKMLVGNQDNLPDLYATNKGHNVYYMLPLLLGLLGIVYQLRKKEKGVENFALTFMLFFMTGLAIVIYLNQTPYQPRERDYAYAGSFYAFCIWIGIGVLQLAEWLGRVIPKWVAAAVAGVVCLGVPALMAQQNWDDHDRSGRYVARDFGHNYLASTRKNAIIFTNGDNDTFPLWYNQEVEGDGTDVRVCNLSYLQTDWYIGQMKRPYYESEALPISWTADQYMQGHNEVAWVSNTLHQPISVKEAYNWLLSDDPRTKRNGESYIPSDQLYVPVNKDDVLHSEAFRSLRPDSTGMMECKYAESQIADRVDIKLKNRITRSEMMVLDMLANNQWKRPMYYAVTVGNDYYQGMEKYFELVGLAYQITPVPSDNGQPRVNTDEMFDNMMNKFRYGNVAQKGIYLDENVLRMCRTHRMMFAQLAESLLAEGKDAQALEVLDKCNEVLPIYNIRPDYSCANMATVYYRLGQFEKGNALINAVAEEACQYLNWGLGQKPSRRISISTTMGHNIALLEYSLSMAQRFNQTEVLDRYEPEFARFRQSIR